MKLILGRGARDGHLDFHTPPELWGCPAPTDLNNLSEVTSSGPTASVLRSNGPCSTKHQLWSALPSFHRLEWCGRSEIPILTNVSKAPSYHQPSDGLCSQWVASSAGCRIRVPTTRGFRTSPSHHKHSSISKLEEWGSRQMPSLSDGSHDGCRGECPRSVMRDSPAQQSTENTYSHSDNKIVSGSSWRFNAPLTAQGHLRTNSCVSDYTFKKISHPGRNKEQQYKNKPSTLRQNAA